MAKQNTRYRSDYKYQFTDDYHGIVSVIPEDDIKSSWS